MYSKFGVAGLKYVNLIANLYHTSFKYFRPLLKLCEHLLPYISGVCKAVLSKGVYFSEIALLYNSERTVEKFLFWVLTRNGFRATVKSVSDAEMNENK